MNHIQPVAVLINDPAWAERAAALVRSEGIEPVDYTSPAGQTDAYIEWLIDRWAALVLVDGDQADWRFWVTVSKTEQATRRIPVLVIAADLDPDEARAAGVDGLIAPGDLATDLIPWVRDHARLVDADWLAQLDCQCQEALPPLAQLGVQKFNAGAYYAQHDAFEEQWMAETGPVRELYRAVLQVGVAYYHISRGNYRGGLKMLRRSVQWFALLPDVCQGIDVRQLRTDAAQVRAALLALDPAGTATFDPTLFKPVSWVDSQRS